jgi:hypothetical protein
MYVLSTTDAPQRARNQPLNDVAVTFRVPYHFTGIRGNMSTLGSLDDAVKLLVLELSGQYDDTTHILSTDAIAQRRTWNESRVVFLNPYRRS